MTYLEYLDSDHWQFLRTQAFSFAHNKCEVCSSEYNLHGHHLIYRPRLIDCTRSDIIALCDKCHKFWHSKHDSKSRYSRKETIKFIRNGRSGPVIRTPQLPKDDQGRAFYDRACAIMRIMINNKPPRGQVVWGHNLIDSLSRAMKEEMERLRIRALRQPISKTESTIL